MGLFRGPVAPPHRPLAMYDGSIIKEDKKFFVEIKKGKIINYYPNHNILGDTIASKSLFNSFISTNIISHVISS
jgi:hypothetical protein